MAGSEERAMDEKKPKTLAEALTQIVVGIGTAVKTVAEAVIPFAKAVYDANFERYKDAGMPYGENHEGLMRWLGDLQEINRLEAEIATIKRRHLLMRDTHLIAERIQEKQDEEGEQKL